MTTRVHPTAQVSAEAMLEDGVEVGPWCWVGPGVHLGAGTRLHAHAVVEGPARLGPGNEVFPFAVLGGAPQDRSYQGEPTTLEVGARNVFREQVTVHRGTRKDRGVTRIGSGGLFMVGCHVAHDAQVGDGVTLANGTMLAGHVWVGDHVVTGGAVAVQPFVRLGEGCFLAGGAMVECDVPPFVIAGGDRARVRGLNKVGLRRRGVPEASVRALEQAVRRLFFGQEPRAEALARLGASDPQDPWVRGLLAFLREPRLRPGVTIEPGSRLRGECKPPVTASRASLCLPAAHEGLARGTGVATLPGAAVPRRDLHASPFSAPHDASAHHSCPRRPACHHQRHHHSPG